MLPWIALLAGLAVTETPRLEGRLDGPELTVSGSRGAPLLSLAPCFGITFTDWMMLGPDDMTLAEVSPDGRWARWEHPRAQVDRVLISGRVKARQGAIMHAALPHSFLLRSTATRALWPEALGVELSGAFFEGDSELWTDAPPAFCDFMSVDIGGRWVHIYRDGEESRPLPVALNVRGGAAPAFRRFYQVYIREGETWDLPPVAVQVGGDLREALLRYKRECGLGRRLEGKADPALLERWRGMAHGTVLPPFASMAEVARVLPLPAVLEAIDWMRGGFDRMYPDFLPPRDAYGGEEGFREFISAAHQHGHLASAYTNWTWWCGGWDGPDSAPAPSLERHGTAALSRGLDGETIEERYGANTGYTVTPTHPVAASQRRQTLRALREDYGVDLPYFDQVGPRRWILDLNPALPDPAAYGASLMEIHREAAAGLPVAVEFGNDRALDFVSAMNYWCLPPLSGHPHWPGVAAPPWPEGQARSYPYALFLSSGDALVDVPECLTPAGLAWAMVLGGRVSLGWALTPELVTGPLGDRFRWLQELARALGPTRGERLLALEYLAPRVLEARYETHRVIANFGDAPWPTEDGLAIAPQGFDLNGDSLRVGHYAGPGGEVSAFRINATGRALSLDARGLRAGWHAGQAPSGLYAGADG